MEISTRQYKLDKMQCVIHFHSFFNVKYVIKLFTCSPSIKQVNQGGISLIPYISPSVSGFHSSSSSSSSHRSCWQCIFVSSLAVSVIWGSTCKKVSKAVFAMLFHPLNWCDCTFTFILILIFNDSCLHACICAFCNSSATRLISGTDLNETSACV